MKFRLISIISLLVVLALAACSSSTPAASTEQPTIEPQTPPTEAAPAEAYPSPAEQVVTEAPQVPAGQPLYPGPQSGDTVLWAQAVAMISNGEVNQILRSQNLELTLNLKDGRSLLTIEPSEGELQIVLENCGDVCAGIEVTGP